MFFDFFVPIKLTTDFLFLKFFVHFCDKHQKSLFSKKRLFNNFFLFQQLWFRKKTFFFPKIDFCFSIFFFLYFLLPDDAIDVFFIFWKFCECSRWKKFFFSICFLLEKDFFYKKQKKVFFRGFWFWMLKFFFFNFILIFLILYFLIFLILYFLYFIFYIFYIVCIVCKCM